MKTIILAGGLGTRISEYTERIPKPMLPVGNKPLIWHIMETYANHGHKDFIVALGYKAQVVKEYFLNYRALNNNFTINLSSGKIIEHSTNTFNWDVTLVDTGLQTMTGGRLKKLDNMIEGNTFLLTYGDGVSNVDINKVIDFHNSHSKMVTITAVRPIARFGELDIANDYKIRSFEEKPQLARGWINGGYMVINKEFLNLIHSDNEMLEREPISRAVELDEVCAYKHRGFWQCVDNKRDYETIQKLYKEGPPWL